MGQAGIFLAAGPPPPQQISQQMEKPSLFDLFSSAGYTSDLEEDDVASKKPRDEFTAPAPPTKSTPLPRASAPPAPFPAYADSEAKRQYFYHHVAGLNAYERHQKFIRDYVPSPPSKQQSRNLRKDFLLNFVILGKFLWRQAV